MAYCDETDILTHMTAAELAQLADLDNDGAADSGVVARCCLDASNAIDGYISPRYTVPITGTAPALLKTLTARWAIYLLQLGRQSVTEDVRKQHEEDVAFLRLVGKGDASLGDPVNAPEGDVSQAARVSADSRAWSRTKMGGW